MENNKELIASVFSAVEDFSPDMSTLTRTISPKLRCRDFGVMLYVRLSISGADDDRAAGSHPETSDTQER